MTDQEQAGLGPIHLARQRLLEDPATKQIADALEVTVEEYVERVLFYAQNPDVEAQVDIMTDEQMQELEEQGVHLPNEREVATWFKGVTSGAIELGPKVVHDKDRLTMEETEEEKRKKAAGIEVLKAAPPVGKGAQQVVVSGEGGANLKNQLLQQQAASRMARDGKEKAQPKPKGGR